MFCIANITGPNLTKPQTNLTLNEQRLVLSSIAQSDFDNPMSSPISISATQFSEQHGIPLEEACKALTSAASALFEQDIRLSEGRVKSRFRLVSQIDYLDSGGGEVRLHFTDQVLPYLHHLRMTLTAFEIKGLAEL